MSDQGEASAPAATLDPRRYFEQPSDQLGPTVEKEPVCLYLETTNRCNLACTTCPRTFEALEPPADMSWTLFTSIVDQFPRIARVVLHGVGEPMMVRDLPRMIRYLKDRSSYVLFNTNGTLLTPKRGMELIDAGLDELRVSLDAAEPKAFALVRGRHMFDQILRNLRRFTALQRELQAATPRVSLWLTGLKETIGQLPAFVRLAHELGIGEVYLQRREFADIADDPVEKILAADREKALRLGGVERDPQLVEPGLDKLAAPARRQQGAVGVEQHIDAALLQVADHARQVSHQHRLADPMEYGARHPRQLIDDRGE